MKEVLGLKIIMWTGLSGDFDRRISAAQCWRNIKTKTREGSIVVFHDSEKAMPRMKQALKNTLAFYSGKNMQFESIS